MDTKLKRLKFIQKSLVTSLALAVMSALTAYQAHAGGLSDITVWLRVGAFAASTTAGLLFLAYFLLGRDDPSQETLSKARTSSIN